MNYASSYGLPPKPIPKSLRFAQTFVEHLVDLLVQLLNLLTVLVGLGLGLLRRLLGLLRLLGSLLRRLLGLLGGLLRLLGLMLGGGRGILSLLDRVVRRAGRHKKRQRNANGDHGRLRKYIHSFLHATK
jgi:hypothetical protein